jgi:tetratricopeptide (TPR) repeat protein
VRPAAGPSLRGALRALGVALAAAVAAGLAAPPAAAAEGARLLEQAERLTWDGRLAEAEALFRRVAAEGGPRERQRAQTGLGRALSWQGRHIAATAAYREALALDPGDAEARRGLARVLSWRGHPHEAAALMQAQRQRDPRDREATWILAESWDWMGRGDRALALLREQVAADPGDERAARKRDDLEAALRPGLRVDLRDFERSDGLAIAEQAVAGRQPLALGRGHAGARLSQATYRPEAGSAGASRIEVQRLGVEGRWRFDDRLEWNGDLGLDRIDSTGAAADHDKLTWSTWLTAWPRDGLRLDLSSTRYTFDSEITLRQGLVATQWALSADGVPDDLHLVNGRLEQTRFSDGNRRQGWELRAQRRLLPQPRLWVGARVAQWRFDRPGQPGYYNPAGYRSVELQLQASGWAMQGLYWELRFAPGRETEEGQASRDIRSGSAQLAWSLRPATTLELAYDHSTSRTQPGSGFARGIARLTLKQRL